MVSIMKCRRCKRPLKRPKCVKRGYGDICYTKMFGTIAMINGDRDLFDLWKFKPEF